MLSRSALVGLIRILLVPELTDADLRHPEDLIATVLLLT